MEASGIETFNEANFKKSLVNFERKHSENQKLRIKHVEEPNKFAASETELFASLNELQGVAAQPELFPILLERTTALTSLLSLLNHENTDISAKVVKILLDLTDTDDDDQPPELVLKALLDLNLLDLLLSNLTKLDANNNGEDRECIANSMEILESLIDHDPEKASRQSSLGLVEWMVKQLRAIREYSETKLSIAEGLSLLLSSNEENKLHLCDAGGIDVLLQQVAKYRKVVPIGTEHEYMSQVFNCLCVAVLHCDKAREAFLEEEGVDLVELILREKRPPAKESNIKMCTLQLFSYVLATEKNQDPIVTKCCERFVEVLGLRVLFPIFNNPKLVLNTKVKRHEYHSFLTEAEEFTSSILLNMLKFTQNSEHIQRILIKFAASNFAKFNRALGLHDKYFKIVQNKQDDDDQDSVKRSAAYCLLKSIDYIILLLTYLGQHFETYDPISGETLTNFIAKTLKAKPQLRHQIVMEARKHIDEVSSDSHEEKNSLTLLLKNFEELHASAVAGNVGNKRAA